MKIELSRRLSIAGLDAISFLNSSISKDDGKRFDIPNHDASTMFCLQPGIKYNLCNYIVMSWPLGRSYTSQATLVEVVAGIFSHDC